MTPNWPSDRVQDHAVRHLRHRLRLHLHAGADGGGQVSQLWDVAFCYSFSLGEDC